MHRLSDVITAPMAAASSAPATADQTARAHSIAPGSHKKGRSQTTRGSGATAYTTRRPSASPTANAGASSDARSPI